MEHPKKKTKQSDLDEALEETFPASDVPAWTASSEYHQHEKSMGPIQDQVSIQWERRTEQFDFTDYNREALLKFGGGGSIQISNPPQYFGQAKYANSEELFISAISSCYMQTFLAVASLEGYTVKNYADQANGTLGQDDQDQIRMIEINLSPVVKFEGVQPSEAALLHMKEKALQNCFITNSVCSQVNIHIQSQS